MGSSGLVEPVYLVSVICASGIQAYHASPPEMRGALPIKLELFFLKKIILDVLVKLEVTF